MNAQQQQLRGNPVLRLEHHVEQAAERPVRDQAVSAKAVGRLEVEGQLMRHVRNLGKVPANDNRPACGRNGCACGRLNLA